MRAWKKAALLLGAAGYGRWVLARNAALEAPPVRDASGVPLPGGEVKLSDGERVAFIDAGRGPPIVWVPGADGVKETWRYQLPAFSASRRCVAADMRRRIEEDHTFDRLADDIAEVMDALGTGPAVVVGQSLGGAVAMRLATRHPPRVRGLVLCNTLARVTYEHVGLNRAALVPLAIGTTRYLPTALARAAARGWSRLSVWIYDESPGRENLVDYALWTGPRTVPARISARRVDLLEREDLRPELGSIDAPTLVVKGPLDSYCLPEWAREIAAGIPGARYAEVPGTGHCSHISMPGRFNRILSDWLEEAIVPSAKKEVAPGESGTAPKEQRPTSAEQEVSGP